MDFPAPDPPLITPPRITPPLITPPLITPRSRDIMANRKRTREDILASILNTIHRKGLTATGLNELFTVSGASSGSFYNYFGSKDELGHALIDFEWNELKTHILDRAIALPVRPAAKLTWMIDRLEEKQLSNANCGGCLLGNFIVDLVERDEAFRQHLQQVFAQWEAIIADLLRQEALLSEHIIDADTLAQQLLIAVEGAMLMGRLYQEPERLRRGFNQARQILNQALNHPTSVPPVPHPSSIPS